MTSLIIRIAVWTLPGFCLLLTGCEGPLSILDPAGPSAREANTLWWAMFGVAALVLLAVVGLWLYAVNRPSSPTTERQATANGVRWLVGGGLILPIVSIVTLLAFGIPAGHRMLPLTLNDGETEVLQIHVTARQWHWEVVYPQWGLRLDNEIHIPLNVPVDIHLTSTDVIHSFWVPRLAGKLDAVPGRTNVLRLQADHADTYLGQCAEFCGVRHAHMQFTLTAHSASDFEQWLQEAQVDD